MHQQIKRLIAESVEELRNLRQKRPDLFRDVPPVLWFGNIEEDTKVLVISANPSRPDRPTDNPRISSSKGWNIKNPSIEQLYNDYNIYFSHENRAITWFGDHCDKQANNDRQGRIEDFLNGMDASFYGTKKNHAVHIDLIPFSTEKSFTEIADEILQIPNMAAWIDKHVRDLIAVINPEIIIINGVSNFDYFNLCVNLGAQPYQIIKYRNTTIWKSTNRKIIGISTNMGSSCRNHWKEIYALGQKVSSILN